MVSIIIISYNTKDLLIECLNSIYRFIQNIDFEVIVVDNNSTDGTIDEVRKFIKTKENYNLRLTIIQNKKNLGFSAANNIGAKRAEGDYLLFLNSDTRFFDASLNHLVHCLKDNKDIGAVGGAMINSDDSLQRTYGQFYTIWNTYKLLFFKEDNQLVNEKEAQNVDWISGGFFLVRAGLFKKVGGFDTNIFMYIEDVELCFRIKKLGYKVFYEPNSRVLHKGQGSSNRSFAVIHIYKGLLYFYKKHKTYFEYFCVKILLVVKATAGIIIGKITRNNYLYTTYSEALKVL